MNCPKCGNPVREDVCSCGHKITAHEREVDEARLFYERLQEQQKPRIRSGVALRMGRK